MSNINNKIFEVDALVVELQLNSTTTLNKGMGFTNGCFDIIHIGHLEYLSQAKKNVDQLIVGLNSDKSVKKLKGYKRPINKQTDRAKFLTYLPFVDYVVIFDEETPETLITQLRPEVLIKGADYDRCGVAGAEFVIKNGGRLELKPFLKGYSTTNLIQKMTGVK